MSDTPTSGENTPERTSADAPATGRFPMLDTWLDDWPELLRGRLPAPWTALGAEAIKVEEFMDDGTLVVRAELPGVDPDEDIHIDVTGNRLDIRATRRRQEEREDDDSFRSEFRYGSFRRSMTLPSGVTADQVTATYNDGILEVRVPVDGEQTERNRVQVTRG